MKHIGNELNSLLSSRRIKKKDFAKKLGMSDVNLSKTLKKESVSAVFLERISIALGVPITFWFDDMMTINTLSIPSNEKEKSLQQEVEQCDKEIHYLKDLLLEKERTIQILMQKYEMEDTQMAAEGEKKSRKK